MSLPLVTPSLAPQEVRQPPEAPLAAFLRLSTVASEIQKEAAIRFVPRPAVPDGEEAAYAGGNCDGSVFPTGGGGQAQCCRESTTGDTWHKISGGSNAGKLLYRSYGTACRNVDGTTGCGVATGSNPVHLEVWLDGQLMISYDDSSASRHTSGMPGIVTGTSATGSKFDSFRVDGI